MKPLSAVVVALSLIATSTGAHADEPKKASDEAKPEVVEPGRFIRYGLTAGFAFMLVSPALAEGTDGARQRNTAATSMPYVLLAPAYWQRPEDRTSLAHLGIWLGKPLAFDASVYPLSGAASQKAEVSSLFAMGVSYLPNSYVTLLLGISFDSFTSAATPDSPKGPEQPEQVRRFTSVVFGLGGNIDVIPALFGK